MFLTDHVVGLRSQLDQVLAFYFVGNSANKLSRTVCDVLTHIKCLNQEQVNNIINIY